MFSFLGKLHWSIYVLSLASGVIMAGFAMLLPLLPAYAETLGFNEFAIGMMVAAFFIGRVMFQFPMGAVSDRVGRKLVMSSSLLLFTAATTAYALTTQQNLMIVLRLLQGIASAGFVVGFQAYVNDLTPARYRGLAHGINSSSINIGIIIGPLLGGTLAEAYSITTPFWVAGILGGICFLLSLTVPAIEGESRNRLSKAGTAISGRVRELMASVLTFPAFSLSLVHFLQMMSLTVFLTAAPLITAELLSWSSTEIALALGLSGGVAAIISPFAGRLADRRGARVIVLAVGLAAMLVEGVIVYIHAGTTITLVGFAIGGAGAPAYFNSFFSLIGDVTTIEERGAVSGFIGSFAEWGSIIGSSLITPILWRNISVEAPIIADVLILIIAIVFSLIIRRPLESRFKTGAVM